MKYKYLICLFFILIFFPSSASSNDIEDMNNYFEIRDTIILMNKEMKVAIASGATSLSLFDEEDIELKLESFIAFMNTRVEEYKASSTKLKYIYIKKLNYLLGETSSLYSQAKPVINSKRRAKSLPLIEESYSSSLSIVTHPYFNPIDFRNLISVEPIKDVKIQEEKLDSTETVVVLQSNDKEEKKNENKDKLAKKIAKSSTKDKDKPLRKAEDEGKAQVIKKEKAKTDEDKWADIGSDSLKIDGFMRPMAIMIENHNQARPQSGLYKADVVYEMPVEGGITRFMAIFNQLPGLIGPVRSCREYFVDRALEIEALYVHCGGSPMGYAYIAKSNIRSIDEIKNSLPFFRDKLRKAPHNLYGRGKKIFEYMAKRTDMVVATQSAALNYGIRNKIGEELGDYLKISYHGNYTFVAKYENEVYHRYMNDILHLDRETKKPLEASALILQVASMKTVDDIGRQEISFIGSGTAWIFEKGFRTQVTWQKASPRSKTTYIDQQGNEYLFNKNGQVWVQVVSPRHKIFFVPEEEKKEEEVANK